MVQILAREASRSGASIKSVIISATIQSQNPKAPFSLKKWAPHMVAAHCRSHAKIQPAMDGKSSHMSLHYPALG